MCPAQMDWTNNYIAKRWTGEVKVIMWRDTTCENYCVFVSPEMRAASVHRHDMKRAVPLGDPHHSGVSYWSAIETVDRRRLAHI